VVAQSFGPDNKTLSEWTSIEIWGYDLAEPGSYSITAVLNMGAYELTKDLKVAGTGFFTSPADNSNTVHIQVVK
jgi:hypothetical protein